MSALRRLGFYHAAVQGHFFKTVLSDGFHHHDFTD